MNLIGFLLRASWITVVIAALTGSFSGACSALLISSINNAISRNDPSTRQLLWSFIGLAIVNLLTSILSQVLLVRLSQDAVHKLRLCLSGWILSCPLQELKHRGKTVLATSHDDRYFHLADRIIKLEYGKLA